MSGGLPFLKVTWPINLSNWYPWEVDQGNPIILTKLLSQDVKLPESFGKDMLGQ